MKTPYALVAVIGCNPIALRETVTISAMPVEALAPEMDLPDPHKGQPEHHRKPQRRTNRLQKPQRR